MRGVREENNKGEGITGTSPSICQPLNLQPLLVQQLLLIGFRPDLSETMTMTVYETPLCQLASSQPA